MPLKDPSPKSPLTLLTYVPLATTESHDLPSCRGGWEMGLAVSREHVGRGDRFAGTISGLCHHKDLQHPPGQPPVQASLHCSA